MFENYSGSFQKKTAPNFKYIHERFCHFIRGGKSNHVKSHETHSWISQTVDPMDFYGFTWIYVGLRGNS